MRAVTVNESRDSFDRMLEMAKREGVDIPCFKLNPHPEEPRGAWRLEVWATDELWLTLRDAAYGRSSG